MRSFLASVVVLIPTGVVLVTPMVPFTKAPPAAIPVRFAPLTAGNVAGNLASGIVPDAKSDASTQWPLDSLEDLLGTLLKIYEAVH